MSSGGDQASTPPHVVVLGGGSAGWITACLLHHSMGDTRRACHRRRKPANRDHRGRRRLDPAVEGVLRPSRHCRRRVDGTVRGDLQARHPLHRLERAAGIRELFSPLPLPGRPAQRAGLSSPIAPLARRGFDVPAHPDDWFLASRLAAEAHSTATGRKLSVRVPATAIISTPTGLANFCANGVRRAGSYTRR